MIRSILVDDDSDFRMLVRIWMEKVEPGQYEVVAEAGTDGEGLELIDRLEPDLVLLDLRMPGSGSIDLISEVREHHPNTTVVVLSGFQREEVEANVIARGADAYVEKSASLSDLLEQLDAIVGSAA